MYLIFIHPTKKAIIICTIFLFCFSSSILPLVTTALLRYFISLIMILMGLFCPQGPHANM